MASHLTVSSRWDSCTVSNGSRPSHQVRVRVRTELLPNQRSRLPAHRKHQPGYGSMNIWKPVWVGWVVSGLPSWSIYRFILGFCCCSLIIVSYEDRIFNSQWLDFACLAECDSDYFGIRVFLLIYRILAHQGGQWFWYVLEYTCDALITQYPRLNIVDAALTLIFRMQQGACCWYFCP